MQVGEKMQMMRVFFMVVAGVAVYTSSWASASPFLFAYQKVADRPADTQELPVYVATPETMKIPTVIGLPATLVASEATQILVYTKKGRTCTIPHLSLIVVDAFSPRYVSGWLYHQEGLVPSPNACAHGTYVYLDLKPATNNAGQAIDGEYYSQSIQKAIEAQRAIGRQSR